MTDQKENQLIAEIQELKQYIQVEHSRANSYKITLRDQFAMHIMSGMCVDTNNNMVNWNAHAMAGWAYRAADAMLEVREAEERRA